MRQRSTSRFFASALWFTALVGCETEVPPTGPCALYSQNDELLAACVTRNVVEVKDLATADAMCASLSKVGADACRTRWVSEASKNLAFQGGDLLQMCAGVADCSFIVLESRVAATYEEQVQRCTYWAGEFAADCVGHAAQRLLNSAPTDDVLRAAALGPHGERIAGMIPGYLKCSGRTACPDLGPQTAVCEASLAHLPPDAGCCCTTGPLGKLNSARTVNPIQPNAPDGSNTPAQ